MSFFGVYLLVSRSENPRLRNRVYVGFTVNPTRRLKQHNLGCAKGGAKKTSSKGPWDMQLILHGFPNMVSALRFEWAWQHPRRSRRLRGIVPKRAKEKVLEFHLRLLGEMMRLGPWNRLALTLQNLRPDLRSLDGLVADPPPHFQIKVGALEDIKTKKDKDDEEIDESLLCALCIEPVKADLQVRCPERRCGAISHVGCLAANFLGQEVGGEDRMIPVKGKCPVCDKVARWGDVVRGMKGVKKGGADMDVEEKDIGEEGL